MQSIKAEVAREAYDNAAQLKVLSEQLDRATAALGVLAIKDEGEGEGKGKGGTEKGKGQQLASPSSVTEQGLFVARALGGRSSSATAA